MEQCSKCWLDWVLDVLQYPNSMAEGRHLGIEMPDLHNPTTVTI